jgi:selenocysteine lyase/cysteine desulfurase
MWIVDGAVRVSFGEWTTYYDINTLCGALYQFTGNTVPHLAQ